MALPASPEVRLEELRMRNSREMQIRGNDPNVAGLMMQIRQLYTQRLLEGLFGHHLGSDALTGLQIEIEETTAKALDDLAAAQVRASLVAPNGTAGPHGLGGLTPH